MNELKKEINNGDFRRVYLFYGEEGFLIRYYLRELRNTAAAGDMNLNTWSGKECTAEKIIAACETLPFMSGRRLIIARDSGFFTAGRKDESEAVTSYLSKIPETAVLLFTETDVDRRGRLFKKVNECGRAVEFKLQPEAELRRWIGAICAKNGLSINPATAELLIRSVGAGMDRLYTELEKLTSYRREGEITPGDIEDVCVKSAEAKVFEMVGAIGKKDAKTALRIYSGLISAKESPVGILSLIARQFRIILQCKHLLQKGSPQQEIASILGLQSFIVRDCTAQSKNFDLETLTTAFCDCLQTDADMKTGKIDMELAVELLIVKYALK